MPLVFQCVHSSIKKIVLCDDKFAVSAKTEILAVGNENQSDEFAFLLLLIGSSDENNSDTKISFWCWTTQWQDDLKLLTQCLCFLVDSSTSLAMSINKTQEKL